MHKAMSSCHTRSFSADELSAYSGATTRLVKIRQRTFARNWPCGEESLDRSRGTDLVRDDIAGRKSSSAGRPRDRGRQGPAEKTR